ncbi:hypothetical protein CFP56_010364 [Quercus suber]|uniref:Uncharacterized protein n=1 Tax=Quercus suber TaxID=58331 RepID=A0AAW0KYX5_QUESU
MVHPTVQTSSVENVLTIPQPPDLVLSIKLIQADSTAFRHVSGAGTGHMSCTFITGKNSRISIADTGLCSGVRVGSSSQIVSVSMKSERPRKLKSEKMRFLMKPRRESAWRKRWEENLGVPDWETHGAPLIENMAMMNGEL